VAGASVRGAIARTRARGSFGASGNGRLDDFISRALKVAPIIETATRTIGADAVSCGKP
jgi:hypothetical protein